MSAPLSWSQPLCEEHWAERHPDGQEPHVLKTDLRSVEICCDCGRETVSGIFMRIDPTTVKYPSAK